MGSHITSLAEVKLFLFSSLLSTHEMLFLKKPLRRILRWSTLLQSRFGAELQHWLSGWIILHLRTSPDLWSSVRLIFRYLVTSLTRLYPHLQLFSLAGHPVVVTFLVDPNFSPIRMMETTKLLETIHENKVIPLMCFNCVSLCRCIYKPGLPPLCCQFFLYE